MDNEDRLVFTGIKEHGNMSRKELHILTVYFLGL